MIIEKMLASFMPKGRRILVEDRLARRTMAYGAAPGAHDAGL